MVPKIPKEVKFTKGEIVEYIGKGFIGFNNHNTEMEFVEYDGHFDAYVKYKGVPFSMLVSKYDLKRKA